MKPYLIYRRATHKMQDGTLATSGGTERTTLTWTDYLLGPAQDWIRNLASQQGGLDHIVAVEVHTEAGKSGVFLSKAFQPAELEAIVEERQ